MNNNNWLVCKGMLDKPLNVIFNVDIQFAKSTQALLYPNTVDRANEAFNKNLILSATVLTSNNGGFPLVSSEVEGQLIMLCLPDHVIKNQKYS